MFTGKCHTQCAAAEHLWRFRRDQTALMVRSLRSSAQGAACRPSVAGTAAAACLAPALLYPASPSHPAAAAAARRK